MVQSQRRLIRLPEVKRQVGLGRTTIYQKIKDGKFPKPHPIGARAVAWDSYAIEAWIDSRISGDPSED